MSIHVQILDFLVWIIRILRNIKQSKTKYNLEISLSSDSESLGTRNYSGAIFLAKFQCKTKKTNCISSWLGIRLDFEDYSAGFGSGFSNNPCLALSRTPALNASSSA